MPFTVCAHCHSRYCTYLPDPRWPGCVDVVPSHFSIPFQCPMKVCETRALEQMLFDMDSHSMAHMIYRAAPSDRYGRKVPRDMGDMYAVADYLATLVCDGSITILGKRVFDPIPPHLVRQPVVVSKKEKELPNLGNLPEIPLAPPATPKKKEEKPRVEAHVVEVPDMLFHLGSPVPLLDEEGWLVGAVATAIVYAKEEGSERQERLVVCGHADTTGEPARNYEIAEQRAQMVKALLDQNVDAWQTLANKHGKVRDYQQILKSLTNGYGWTCDPGAVDNVNGPQTEAALRAFQQECHDRYNMDLKVDGIIGPQTWGALHRAICGLVCAPLDIPENAKPEAPQWLKPAYGYPAGQGVYSCGESFPLVAVGRDNVASQENRRVELVFAPKDLQLKGAPSKNVNMTQQDCVLYDRERVKHVGVVILRKSGMALGKVCVSFVDIIDKPIQGFMGTLHDGSEELWSGTLSNHLLEVLDVPMGSFTLQVDIKDVSFTYSPAWAPSDVDAHYQVCQIPMILEEYYAD